MKKYFQKQFEYNLWANKVLVETVYNNNIKDEKILELLSHIASVEELWLERLKETPNYLMDVWEVFSIQEIEVLIENSSLNWQKFIKRIGKKVFNEKMCTYSNSAGENITTRYIDIISHVLHHSNYHRGQIVFLFHDLNIDPAPIRYGDFLKNV